MASTRQLKSRIRSVGSTRQITKAMQLVAASKMRRAQESSQQTALYSGAARDLLAYLGDLTDIRKHPLFKARKINRRMLIIITSNRGLAGAYNANVLRRYAAEVRADDNKGVLNSVIAIGRKGAQFVSRLRDVEVVGVYQEIPERPTGMELRPVIATAVEQFLEGRVDAVDVVYTRYLNSINQQATIQRLLPAGFDEQMTTSTLHPAFEPSVEEVLEKTTVRLIEALLFQALLDSSASEHSMRMVAMKNATDNAGDLIDDLTLEMNKVRQAGITRELAEISGGSEAMK